MTVLQTQGLAAQLGQKRILSDVSVSFSAGQVTGLIGPNGAGKSTLIKALCRLIEPAAGTVQLDGAPLAGYARRDLARRLGYLPQGHTTHWPLCVEQVVTLGRLPHLGPFEAAAPEDARMVEEAMAKTDVLALRDRRVDTLSGGERARVMLARVLASQTPVLLADEPVAALDPYHQLHLMDLLGQLAAEGRLVVCVLHDLALAARFCDRLVLMDRGRVVATGPADQVLAPGHLRDTYRIRALYGAEQDEPYVLPWRRVAASASSNRVRTEVSPWSH
ncbi:iron complex transport system ATP-binding protein [Rhodothalassium salexigens DSM 2132]|uniref:Iron complex transport system ATP-binding protein n=1 Tax=Rhodothalassium salexigens DSM 2132 TaxID=1188247 RepID=A0A4R2PGR4_RHOSA|nr:heme ABC transporter ATP-binding protein [Rhodothalassium salexigens]MBB4211508.1 iron complex transport system ATP-binding protein [Rhodothalassium salexigens DSM 2132]MBK1639745.1 heme ABC transporter ATP-binding protein [Rhodothalassium salexigens DSM 2132]TCP34560.1 iron complex transport system ATP-binding protein [Rhodothalassium salexigens DSM 2132]